MGSFGKKILGIFKISIVHYSVHQVFMVKVDLKYETHKNLPKRSINECLFYFFFEKKAFTIDQICFALSKRNFVHYSVHQAFMIKID